MKGGGGRTKVPRSLREARRDEIGACKKVQSQHARRLWKGAGMGRTTRKMMRMQVNKEQNGAAIENFGDCRLWRWWEVCVGG